MKQFKEEFKHLLENTFCSRGMPIDIPFNNMIKFVNEHIPTKLYRFRACNSYSLQSFEENTIVMCNPMKFVDKFDSWIFVDNSKVQDMIRNFYKQKGIIITDELSNAIDLYTKKNSKFCQNAMKNTHIQFACFTERIDSLYMWDHYTDGYRGFALEYDFKNFDKNNTDTLNIILPVIYSDYRYDITPLVNWVKMFESWFDKHSSYKFEFLDDFAYIKTYLYKDAEYYSIEREWRLFSMNKDYRKDHYEKLSDFGTLKAIYYGQDIQPWYKTYLSKIAKQKGIKEYDVMLDENSPGYSLKIKEIK
ncbi:MAG: DUF2971 domain-containing protein [Bacteroidales bacterium]|nr:DUF2971 domain-containing protein [Bacteroidales bacterium]